MQTSIWLKQVSMQKSKNCNVKNAYQMKENGMKIVKWNAPLQKKNEEKADEPILQIEIQRDAVMLLACTSKLLSHFCILTWQTEL